MRFQSTQVLAYLNDDLWLKMARNSNQRMVELAAGLAELPVEFINRPDVNMLFVRMPSEAIEHLVQAGLLFYRMSPDTIRLVTSWQTTESDITTALAHFHAALA